eukprot:5975258-Pyramimonas_sp.AAC.1
MAGGGVGRVRRVPGVAQADSADKVRWGRGRLRRGNPRQGHGGDRPHGGAVLRFRKEINRVWDIYGAVKSWRIDGSIDSS